MKALISKLLDAGIMVSLEGNKIHYKAYRQPDKEKAAILLRELKARKQEALAYLARQKEIYKAYQALFRQMSELYRTRGVPRALIDELLELDKKVDALEPGTIEHIHALHRKIQKALNGNTIKKTPKPHTQPFRRKTNATQTL